MVSGNDRRVLNKALSFCLRNMIIDYYREEACEYVKRRIDIYG